MTCEGEAQFKWAAPVVGRNRVRNLLAELPLVATGAPIAPYEIRVESLGSPFPGHERSVNAQSHSWR